MSYSAVKANTKFIVGSPMPFPSEYYIRIFKGSYPKLDLNKSQFKGKLICDVGCGDGRNNVVLHQCGFKISNVEISDEIINHIKANMKKLGIKADVRTGANNKIPFSNNYFDYLVSWNACYYMGERRDFDSYVDEFARVMKKNGYLIMSIPKKTAFIFKGSKKVKLGYQVIMNDPFNVRNGEVLRVFESENEIKKVFSKHFKNFIFGSVHDDCFGFNYHWHLVVCQKR